MKVDPDNRLVTDELEAEWNRQLRALAEAQKELECRRQADKVVLDEAQRARMLALATDIPRLWREPTAPDRERKCMVRLLSLAGRDAVRSRWSPSQCGADGRHP